MRQVVPSKESVLSSYREERDSRPSFETTATASARGDGNREEPGASTANGEGDAQNNPRYRKEKEKARRIIDIARIMIREESKAIRREMRGTSYDSVELVADPRDDMSAIASEGDDSSEAPGSEQHLMEELRHEKGKTISLITKMKAQERKHRKDAKAAEKRLADAEESHKALLMDVQDQMEREKKNNQEMIQSVEKIERHYSQLIKEEEDQRKTMETMLVTQEKTFNDQLDTANDKIKSLEKIIKKKEKEAESERFKAVAMMKSEADIKSRLVIESRRASTLQVQVGEKDAALEAERLRCESLEDAVEKLRQAVESLTQRCIMFDNTVERLENELHDRDLAIEAVKKILCSTPSTTSSEQGSVIEFDKSSDSMADISQRTAETPRARGYNPSSRKTDDSLSKKDDRSTQNSLSAYRGDAEKHENCSSAETDIDSLVDGNTGKDVLQMSLTIQNGFKTVSSGTSIPSHVQKSAVVGAKVKGKEVNDEEVNDGDDKHGDHDEDEDEAEDLDVSLTMPTFDREDDAETVFLSLAQMASIDHR